SLYICSNSGESSLSATSASSLISLIGWLAGTRFSGLTSVSIVLCARSYPRIFLFLLNPTGLVPLYRCKTFRRSHRRGVSQHPARARSSQSTTRHLTTSYPKGLPPKGDRDKSRCSMCIHTQFTARQLSLLQ